MSKEIVIIGGGIIGLSCAYYLQKEGHQVTVIDKSNFTSGASFVNAGYITPSHIVPLSSPGIINKGIIWMFNSSSPFYVKPRLDFDFLQWAYAFKKSATDKKVKRAMPVIKDINIISRDLYAEMKSENIFDFAYDHKGLLMLYKTDKAGEEEWKVAEEAIKLGLKVDHLRKEELNKIDPKADFNCKGAIFFHSDAHMTPNNFIIEFRNYLEKVGVKILANEEILSVKLSNNRIRSIQTTNKTFKADEFVLAAGAWSQNFAKKINLNIPIQAGKGYRINVTRETYISIPAILCEAKVAVTPMQGFTRFAGTMELGGINHKINPVRVNAIASAAEKYYNHLKINTEEKQDAQCGLRPCSPDGLPFIGKSKKCTNLTIATGHAMMGWSLGPATGKLVSEVIDGKNTSMDINPFHPDRKF
ncbi:MAG: FAD-dependent oxidoreductase [Flavobacteriaceae bacterium]|nr:FAD-dependent oxidoreductase [Flavobacteriaceae bacterium]